MYTQSGLLSCLIILATCAAGIYIADREYTQSILLSSGSAYARIVCDSAGTVLFLRYNDYRLYRLTAGTTEGVGGLPNVSIGDILLLPSGEVLVGAWPGIYQYNLLNKSMRYLVANDKKIFRMSSTGNGTLYFTDTSNNMFVVHGQSLVPVPNVKAICFAFSQEGHMYYAAGSPVYKREGGPTGTDVALTGLPISGNTNQLEVDQRDNILFICYTVGLFYVQPGSIMVTQVEGYTDVRGLGISHQGNIYLGANNQILQLLLISSDTLPIQKSIEINNTKIETDINHNLRNINISMMQYQFEEATKGLQMLVTNFDTKLSLMMKDLTDRIDDKLKTVTNEVNVLSSKIKDNAANIDELKRMSFGIDSQVSEIASKLLPKVSGERVEECTAMKTNMLIGLQRELSNVTTIMQGLYESMNGEESMNVYIFHP